MEWLSDAAIYYGGVCVMALWTPADTTTALWLDASDSSTLYDATSGGSLVAANGDVARWQDKSGNSRHLTQSTLASRPVRRVANQNGLDIIEFNTDQWIATASAISGMTSATLVFIAKTNTSSPAFSDSSFPFYAMNGTDHYPFLDGNIYHQGFSTLRKTITGPVPNTAQWRVLTSLSADASWKFSIDGSVLHSTNTSTFSSDLFRIGENRGFSYLGKVSEYVLIPNTDATTVQKIEGYLAHKWDLQANLPSDHPYKTAAPIIGGTRSTFLMGVGW